MNEESLELLEEINKTLDGIWLSNLVLLGIVIVVVIFISLIKTSYKFKYNYDDSKSDYR